MKNEKMLNINKVNVFMKELYPTSNTSDSLKLSCHGIT